MQALSHVPSPLLKLSERSVTLRRRLGWTQSDLARNLGVCRRTVVTMERGYKVVKSATLGKFAMLRKRTLERFEMLEKRQKGMGRGK